MDDKPSLEASDSLSVLPKTSTERYQRAWSDDLRDRPVPSTNNHYYGTVVRVPEDAAVGVAGMVREDSRWI